jgi:hypothetical protein
LTTRARLTAIREAVLAMRSYEMLGRDEPAVLDAVIGLLIGVADAVTDLDPALVATAADGPWGRARELAAWRALPRETLYGQVWSTVAEVEPLADIALGVILRGAGGDDGELRPTGWFTREDGTRDYTYVDGSAEPPHAVELQIPGIGSFPCLCLVRLGVWIQLPPKAAAALSGEPRHASVGTAPRLGPGA